MKISRVTLLPATLSDAWDALHNPEVFQAVSRPFLHFTAVSPTPFPLRYESKNHYLVEARAFGLLPMGEQEINPVGSSSGDKKIFVDNGRGVSGLLARVTTFTHQMTLQPSGTGPTLLHDQLEFRAGALTPFLWIGFKVFWWWRHLRMRALAPTWHNVTTSAWESRYVKKAWSGRVNQTLVDTISDLDPGTALEVGAGEGADALWLAERGFNVTAIDASPTALMRAEAERRKRVNKDATARTIRFIAADLVIDNLPVSPKKYDLITAHFLHLQSAERAIIWKKMVAAVAPGGSLLIVGHSAQDLKTGVKRPPAESLFGAKELRALIPSSWKNLSVTEVARDAPGPDGTPVQVRDIVFFATR